MKWTATTTGVAMPKASVTQATIKRAVKAVQVDR
jgi:hypothetical protein